ncbi:MAG: hypothetical protein H7330_00735 [Hymenobacteraceae bacterium]|nr:hypothetical protein [Hymenobacteraceae bacterium]
MLPYLSNFRPVALAGLWLSLLGGCAAPTPDLPGLDAAAFRADRRGCAGYRDAHRLIIKSLSPKLLGLREGQVSRLLGRPDAAGLGDRGQRVYLYSLTPGPACGASARALEPTLLRVRFNAVDRVSEALVME